MNNFGFTVSTVIYDTDPTRPIGNWKEAWEKAKQRTGAILGGELEKPLSPAPSRGGLCQRTEAELNKESHRNQPGSLKCRFHDLRHSAVTRLLEGGIPYPVVASMMGWSAATAIRMSKRYGHIGSQALRAAADVLGGIEIPTESLKKSPKSQEQESVTLQ